MKIQKESLKSDDQQFYQYQQNKQLHLNSDGQKFYQYQENKQSPLNSDGQMIEDQELLNWTIVF